VKVLGIRCCVPRRDSLAQAFDVCQGETGLAQAGLPLGEAVTVGTARDEQTMFRGHAAERKDLLGTVRRMENFDPLQTDFHEVGKTAQRAAVRMGQDGDPPGLPDGSDGLSGGEFRPFHIRWPTLGEETVEGLLQIAHRSSRKESPGHMKPTDSSLAGDLEDLGHGKGDSQSVQAAEDFVEAVPTLTLQEIQGLLERRIVPMDEVAQDMHLLVHLVRREFDARDDLDVHLNARLKCLRDSGNGVMVGKGNWADIVADRPDNNLPRGKGSVREAGMQVKVGALSHPLSPWRMVVQSHTCLTIGSLVGQRQVREIGKIPSVGTENVKWE
jgi:hypothetical protein